MTNFCGNCGTVVPEGSAVCPNCGAPVAAAAPVEAPKAGFDLKNNKTIIIAAAAVVAVIVAVIAFVIFGNSPKSVAKKYLKAEYKSMNAKKVYKTYHKKYVEYLIEEADKSKDKFYEEAQDDYDDWADEMDDEYDKWSYSYKVYDVCEVKNDKKKPVIEWYEDELDLKIKDIKEVRVLMQSTTVEDKDKYINAGTESIYVAKIGAKWYRVSMYVPTDVDDIDMEDLEDYYDYE